LQKPGQGDPVHTPLATEPPPSALPPGAIIDRYEVLDLLGVGGMASVYRARHRQLDSFVALKVLVLDRPSVRRRVEREGKVQASLRHPNLVAVTDSLSTPGGTPVLVLEYVDGPPLDRLLRARRLPLCEVDLLVRGILRGVAHAHAAGVVHRDLKPANVLLARTEQGLVPKLTDFGIVKLCAGGDATRTLAGQLMGTPGYMAPEQFSDASGVDARADLWSLGVLMYELCTGRPPYGSDDPQAVFSRLVSGRMPDLGGLPERMAQAIRSALQFDPALRVPDAQTLLRTWCGGISDEQVAQSFGLPDPWSVETLAVAASLSPVRTISPSVSGSLEPPPPQEQATTWLLPPPERPWEVPLGVGLVLAVVAAGLGALAAVLAF
jgi:serine/threonine protein kinase